MDYFCTAVLTLETAETVYGVRLDPGTLEIAAILRDTGETVYGVRLD